MISFGCSPSGLEDSVGGRGRSDVLESFNVIIARTHNI
jgi:hypothetical protein